MKDISSVSVFNGAGRYLVSGQCSVLVVGKRIECVKRSELCCRTSEGVCWS